MIAIYSRVSTGMQVKEGTSLDNQVELCTKKAYELGFKYSDINCYKEEGFTGEDIDRPALNNLRQDAVDRKITHVIVTDPDRLSRNMIDKLIICNEFEKYNIQLVFVDAEYTNTPEGQLFFNMRSAIAQYELSLIRKRTSRGRLNASVKQQKVMPMGIVAFGYKWEECKLIVIPEEAKYVKLIYQWYIFDSLTMREIGEKLYAHGVMPKSQKSTHWGASSISRILSSETYVGRFYYNKKKSKKLKGQKTESGNPKMTYEIRDKSEWVLVEVPAIIDDGIFQMAQEKKKRNLTNSGNVKTDYLLRSMIRCGDCGRRWDSTSYSGNLKDGEKKKYRIYRCGNTFPKKYGGDIYKCKNHSIKAEILEEYIWNMITNIIQNPKQFQNKMQHQDNNAAENIKQTIESMQVNLYNKDKEKERIKIMFRKDIITEDEMFNDIKSVNKEIEKLQLEIDKLKYQIIKYDKSEITYNHILNLVENIKPYFNNDHVFDFKLKRQIVEMLIDEIIIKIAEDGCISITCTGNIDDFITQKNNVMLCTQRQENMDTTLYKASIIYSSKISLNKIGKQHETQIMEDSGVIINVQI